MKNVKNDVKVRIDEINNEFGLSVSEEGKIITTSLKVAEIYGKEHKNVMAKIRRFIELIPELGELNFKPTSYLDKSNRQSDMYLMDRQGFSMLVNKFTGDEALMFTYKYTKAFEEMVMLIEQLKEDNDALYTIATSNDDLEERQYEADKIRYCLRNINYELTNADHKNLEEVVAKFIDVHSNLKVCDRYKPDQKLTATEYKQKVRKYIDKRLDLYIKENGSNAVNVLVALEIQNNLKENRIKTINMSTSHKGWGKRREENRNKVEGIDIDKVDKDTGFNEFI